MITPKQRRKENTPKKVFSRVDKKRMEDKANIGYAKNKIVRRLAKESLW